MKEVPVISLADAAKKIKKAIGSFFTSNPEAVKAEQDGDIEIQLIPQGSLADAIWAGGAGIGGFYTPTAVGTVIAENDETKKINGKLYVFIPRLRADVAFIRAWKADMAGNLIYRMTEQNFNKTMATAADLVIAEVQEIVPIGELDPNHIHPPGKPLLGVGGAMDLATGAKRLIIIMTHTDRNGNSKIVPQCTLPLTAAAAVDMVITDLAVFTYPGHQLTLIELLPNATMDQVKASTEAKFVINLN